MADADGFAALLSGFDDADDDGAAEPLLAAMDDGAADDAADGPESSQQQHDDEPNEDWAALCAAAEDEDEDAGSGGIEPPAGFESFAARPAASSSAAAAKPATSFANMFASEAVSQSFAASIKETMGNAAPAPAASARSAVPVAAAAAASSFTPRVAVFNRSTPPATQVPTPTPIPIPATASSQRRSTSTADFGSRPAAAAPAAVSSTYAPPEKDDTIRDTISGFKLANRLVSSLVLKDKISGSLVLGLRAAAAKKKAAATVTPFNQGGGQPAPGGALGILGNFVVFGVVTHKSLPKATSTGKGHFMLWTLSDLEGTAATILLFGKAFQAYATKVPEGAVIAIANPEEGGKGGSNGGGGSSGGGSNSGWKGSSSSNAASSAPSLCFALKHLGQVLHLGASADFGYCKSFRNEPGTHGGSQKSMARCKNVVNLSKGDYCEYHVKAEYKKIMSSRADLNQSRDRSQVAFSKGEVVGTHAAVTKRSNAIGSSIALRASMHQRGLSAAAAGRTAQAPPPAANAADPFHWTLDGFREALGSNSLEERKAATAGMPALTLMLLMNQDPDLLAMQPFTAAQRVQYKANADAARKKIAMQQAKQQRGTLGAAPESKYTPAELKAEAQRQILLSGGTLKGGCKAALKVHEAKTAPSEIAAGAARWDALSDRSKASSRFVQRVVATQLGSVGAPVLTTKDMGMMSAVDKISQSIKHEAQQQGSQTSKMSDAQLKAAAIKSAQTSGQRSVAPAAVSASSALANFSYTSKHLQQQQQPQSSLAAALANKPQTASAPAKAVAAPTTGAAPSSQRSTAHVPSAAAAAAPSARPSTAAIAPASSATAAPKPATQPTPRPASGAAAAPSPAPAPSPPRLAVPSGTFIQSFGSAAPAAALGSGLVPMLGRGWSHSSLSPAQSTGRPLVLNATERAAAATQAAQLARVAELRASGALGKLDPNSTATQRLPLRPLTNGSATVGAKRKQADSDDPAAAAKSQYSLNANGSITLTKSAAAAMTDDSAVIGSAPVSESAAALASKRARLSDAFGFSASASAMDRMLDSSVGSKHSGLIVESASSVAAQEALFNLMEKRETLAVHLNSITAQSVKAYRCTHAGCSASPSEFPLSACKSKGHRLERVDMHKRFFTCAGCKFHLTTLGSRMPTHACHKCGGTVWNKAAMIPMKIESSDRDQLQLRSEETWLRSVN